MLNHQQKINAALHWRNGDTYKKRAIVLAAGNLRGYRGDVDMGTAVTENFGRSRQEKVTSELVATGQGADMKVRY